MLQAEVDTGWRKTPILEAELGAEGDAPFVLFSGHHDTWYYGVMDNGSANATMLEVARLCVAQREQWQRGLRLCFWSGHSHGRYSGSTWYVDEHWDELDRRCVAHINVDSPGAEGADILENVGSMSELGALAAEAIETQAGQRLLGKRMSRGADQSFNGVGLPAIFGDLSEPVPTPVGAHCWWWHTPDDLADHISEKNLVRDTQDLRARGVAAADRPGAAARLCGLCARSAGRAGEAAGGTGRVGCHSMVSCIRRRRCATTPCG